MSGRLPGSTQKEAKPLYRSLDGLLGSIKSLGNFSFFGFNEVDRLVVEVGPLFLRMGPTDVFSLVSTSKVLILNFSV